MNDQFQRIVQEVQTNRKGKEKNALVIIDSPDHDWYYERATNKLGAAAGSGSSYSFDHIFAVEIFRGQCLVLQAWQNWFCTNDWIRQKKTLDMSDVRINNNIRNYGW